MNFAVLNTTRVSCRSAATELTDASFEDTAIHVTFRTANADRVVLRGKRWEAELVVALVACLLGIPLD